MNQNSLKSALIWLLSTVLLYWVSTYSYWLYSGLHLLLIPLVPFGMWKIWRGYHKQRPKTIGRYVGLFFALALVWGREIALHAHSPELETTEQVEVLSYNLYFRNTLFSQTTEWLRKQDADILALQEVTPSWAHALAEKLQASYPYRTVIAREGTHGLAFYSKHPIATKVVRNNAYGLPIAQQVSVQVGSQTLTIVNAHTASPAGAVEGELEDLPLEIERNARVRYQQFRQLSPATKEPLVLLGDLNTHRWEYLYQQMRREFVEAHAEAGQGLGLSFPNTNKLPIPVFRLDHIFVRGEAQIIASETHYWGFSDHFPISATLQW